MKLEIIAIIQENIEVLRISYVYQNIVYLEKFLQVFIMDLTIIIILSLGSWQTNLKNNFLVQDKILKKIITFKVPIEKEVI